MNEDNANNNIGSNNNANSNSTVQNATGQQNNNANQPNSNSNGIDYTKIQEMIDGRNARTEDSILKDYFQKQGLSTEEMKTAIDSFKTEKAQKVQEQNQNNLNLQNENATLKAQIQKMQIENKARDVAGEIGIDAKTVPFLIKLADLSTAVDGEGKISDEAIKTAFNDILEALPQLKAPFQENSQNNTGFQKVGGENNESKNNENLDSVLKDIFS